MEKDASNTDSQSVGQAKVSQQNNTTQGVQVDVDRSQGLTAGKGIVRFKETQSFADKVKPKIQAPKAEEIQEAARQAFQSRQRKAVHSASNTEQENLGPQSLSALQKHIKHLKETISIIERRFSSTKKLHKDQYQQLQGQLDTLEKRLMQTHHLSAQTQERINDLIPDYQQQQKEQTQQFVALNGAHQQVVQRLENQLQIWTKEIENHLSVMQTTQQRSADQSAQMEKLDKCMRTLQSELVKALSQFQAESKDNKKIQAVIEHTANKHKKDYEQMRRELDTELSQARKIHQQLQAMLKEISAGKQSAFSDYDTLRRALKSDRAKLDKERKNLAVLSDELSRLLDLTTKAQELASEHQQASIAQLSQVEKMAVCVEKGLSLNSGNSPQSLSHQAFMKAQSDIQAAFQKELSEGLEQLNALKEKIDGTEAQLTLVKTSQGDHQGQLSALSQKTQMLEKGVAKGLDKLQRALDQYHLVEDNVKRYTNQLEEMVNEQAKGLEKISTIEARCDHSNALVEDLKVSWQQWEKEWQEKGKQWEEQCQKMHCANDEQYKNLSALLVRSRENETELERLLESVKSLEKRSEYLLESAQVQRQKQHEFAQSIQSDQQQLAQVREESKSLVDIAKKATDKAQSMNDDAQNILKVAQGVQSEMLIEHEQLLEKTTETRQWVTNALKQVQQVYAQTQSMAERQQELEAKCSQLIGQGDASAQTLDALLAQATELCTDSQQRLEKSEQLHSLVSQGLTELGQQLETLASEREGLAKFKQAADKVLADALSKNEAMASQSLRLQDEVKQQVQQHAKAQSQLNTLVEQVSEKEAGITSALQQTQTLHQEWETHRVGIEKIEERTHDALLANQTLHEAVKSLLDSASDEQQQMHALMAQAKSLVGSVSEAVSQEKILRHETEKMQSFLQDKAKEQSKISEDQASMMLRTEVMHDQITELEKNNRATIEQMESLHKRASSLLSENIELQSEIRQGQAQLEQLSSLTSQNLDRTEQINEQSLQQLEACQSRCDQIDNALPKLNEQLERYQQLGSDYAQWESRLKSQSMTLKDSERNLKEQMRRLDVGLSDVQSVREQFQALENTTGNVKKVLAQVMQKFKSVEHHVGDLNTRCDALGTHQAQDRESIHELEAKITKLMGNTPDASRLNEAIEAAELQREFNDSVLDKIDSLAKRYVSMQEQMQYLHQLPETVSSFDQRIENLEALMTRLSSTTSATKLQDLGQQVGEHHTSIEALSGQLGLLREELSHLSKTARAVAMPDEQSLHQQSYRTIGTIQLPTKKDTVPAQEPALGQAQLPKGAKEQTSEKNRELDRLSAQLERLSKESQVWEEVDQEKKKTGIKQFLFSILVLMGVFGASFYSPNELADPTFAHNKFMLKLLHPASELTGPTLSEGDLALIQSHQKTFALDIADQTYLLQWPLTEGVHFSTVSHSLVNNASFLQAHPNAPVVAIAPGEVVFSGLGQGNLGRVVIVEHANDLVSVYGFLNETWVHSGASVLRGQVIAGLSATPQPKLYFEIRHADESLALEPIYSA